MRLFRSLYAQVLLAIVAGVLLGTFQPELGAQLKPLGDAFIKLIKMLVGPIIFTTVVSGIAGMSDMKKAGRVGVKAIIYFEIVTTLALVIGLLVVNWAQPGAGVNATLGAAEAKSVAAYTTAASHNGVMEWLLQLIPNTFVSAFVDGDLLQVLLVALLFAFALGRLGERAQPLRDLLHQASQVFFGIVGFVTKLAPIAAFGAMAFTVGQYGLGSLLSLGKLMLCVYATCLMFIFGVLGLIARLHGFSLWRLLTAIREELLIVLGTSSSESVLPRMMQRMEEVGCAKPVVSIVLPAGYSFNLDGTCIYLTMAAVFIAQATNTPLSFVQELGLLAVLLVTSKGAAGVTGSGFVTLAATLSVVGHVPAAGIALILGVDRFMSEARALTNLCGNAVATIVVSLWEGEFDRVKGARILRSSPAPLEPDLAPRPN